MQETNQQPFAFSKRGEVIPSQHGVPVLCITFKAVVLFSGINVMPCACSRDGASAVCSPRAVSDVRASGSCLQQRLFQKRESRKVHHRP